MMWLWVCVQLCDRMSGVIGLERQHAARLTVLWFGIPVEVPHVSVAATAAQADEAVLTGSCLGDPC